MIVALIVVSQCTVRALRSHVGRSAWHDLTSCRVLKISLKPEEHAEVVRKSGFAFMKAHEEQFEMTPPSLLSELAPQTFMPTGNRERENEGALEERRRIMCFCEERLANSPYPLRQFYASV